MPINVDDANWIPFDKEEVSATTSPAVGLSSTKLTDMAGRNNNYIAKILVSGYPIAWQETGATAGGSDKNVAQVGDVFFLGSLYAMTKFSAIGVGGTSVLAVTYYKAT